MSMILPLFTQAVGLGGLALCSIDIPAVQVEMTGIYQHRSDPRMMVLAKENFARPGEESQSIRTDFQVPGVVRPSRPAGLRPMEQIKRNQSLNVSSIDQGTGQVGWSAKALE